MERATLCMILLGVGLLLPGCPRQEPPGDCGEVTSFGQCAGQTLRYCYEGRLLELDCASRFGSEALCFEVAPSWGYDCGVRLGSPCLYDNPDRDGSLVAFCDGEQAGCYLAAGEAYCRAGLFSCTSLDEGSCRGEMAVLYCFADQPLVLQCSDWGARCEGGECVGVEEGGFCTEPLVRCAAGLRCGADNRCQGEPSDAGVPEDGGEPRCSIPGDLILRGPTDLLGFRDSGCDQVLGSVRIEGASLANLDGLERLTRIGGELRVIANEGLLDLRGLGGLREVGGGVTLTGNPALSDLGGLTNLERIGGELRLVDDAGLMSLRGLESLRSVGGALFLTELPLLAELSLPALSSLGGELGLYGLASLRAARFEALSEIGAGLILSANPRLLELDLGLLVALGGDLRAVGNASLSTCLLSDLASRLRAGGWAETEEIRENGPCP